MYDVIKTETVKEQIDNIVVEIGKKINSETQ